jgi:hypothetical protein
MDEKFKKDMKELIRIKLSLETDIDTGKEIEEFSVNPRHLKTKQFNEWYERIENRYREHNEFIKIKEEQLYKWEATKPSFLSSVLNTLSVTLYLTFIESI